MLETTIISPAMMKMFSDCGAKFYYRYIEQIPLPRLDKSFAAGKNIHALASYYLRGENISKFEKILTPKENEYWNYLKNCMYFNNEPIGIEKNISCRLGEFWIGGRIDAIVKKDNAIFILDYKTGGVAPDMTYDYQTMVYLYLCSQYYKDYESLSFVYIDLKNKQDVKIEYNKTLEKEYISKLKNICSSIKNFDITKFKHPDNCRCEYSNMCRYGL